MKRVAILAVENGALFELGCAAELFGLPRPEYEDWYQCDVVSLNPGPLTFTTGIQLQAKVVKSLRAYEMLVVPGWPTGETQPDKKLAREITRFYRAGKRILSLCSGAFLLGELGLLDGRKATTHWRYAERFKARFPQVTYVENVLYVYDGRLGCSAGSAAALDLGIEVIRSDFGYKVANQVARRLVLSSHRKGGQSQFVETPVLHAPGKFSEALDWALKHLASPITVGVLADKASMSRRTFDRKFKTTFNLSPNQWLINQRLALAKNLLEEKCYHLETIAELAGFGSVVTLRHHFNKSFGISPRRYREQFNGR